MQSTLFSQLLKKVSQIPHGKITTYKLLAQALGRPKAYRVVGTLLNKNPYLQNAEDKKQKTVKVVPCHRVIKSNGEVGGYARGNQEKIKLLRKEGIKIINNKVQNFENCLYLFS